MHLIPDPERFDGIRRDYTHQDVLRLSGRFRIRHTLAEMGATRLWQLLKTEPFVPTLGALTGNQAVQQVKAGLQAIYLSGWQVAADANTAGQMYPDQSLYPVDSVPNVVRRINNALRRTDQIAHSEGDRQHLLDGADRGGCGGRLRRRAERIRADEGDDRGRGGRRALRGPARLGEEVRPPRRQGAGADGAAHPHAERGTAGSRRRGRAHRAAVPHRCALGAVAHHGCGRARPSVHLRRAHGRGVPSHPARPRRGVRDRPQPGVRTVCRPAVVGDQRA